MFLLSLFLLLLPKIQVVLGIRVNDNLLDLLVFGRFGGGLARGPARGGALFLPAKEINSDLAL